MKLTHNYSVLLFTEYLTSRAFSPITKEKYQRTLRDFFYWLSETKKIDDLRDVKSSHILIFLEAIKDKYSPSTTTGIISTLRHLFRFLYRSEKILSNPFDTLEIRIKKSVDERTCIDEQTMNTFLDSINPIKTYDIRDRSLFELMYGTGLRVSEVSALDVMDADLNNGNLFIRNGKGGKDRIVPLGSHTMDFLKLYIKKGRPKLLKNIKDKEQTSALFVTFRGTRTNVPSITSSLKNRFKQLGIESKVSPHMIRHSFATHMLTHGADIKVVKEILGHSSLETTVLYTHLSGQNLKKLLKMYHPRENELYQEFSEKELKTD